jgi:hypothetical protein
VCVLFAFFLFFILSSIWPLATYLPTVGAEGYCTAWSHSVTHSYTHHTRSDSSGRRICPSQRRLPGNTQHLQRQTSIRQRNSNPQSHQANGRIRRPLTARPLDSLDLNIQLFQQNLYNLYYIYNTQFECHHLYGIAKGLTLPYIGLFDTRIPKPGCGACRRCTALPVTVQAARRCDDRGKTRSVLGLCTVSVALGVELYPRLENNCILFPAFDYAVRAIRPRYKIDRQAFMPVSSAELHV